MVIVIEPTRKWVVRMSKKKTYSRITMHKWKMQKKKKTFQQKKKTKPKLNEENAIGAKGPAT